MIKRVILLLLILGLSAIFFIPVNQQKTISINAPFLNVYDQLSNSSSWEKWLPDLKEIRAADSNKISIRRDSNLFVINYPGSKLEVKTKGNLFAINEVNNNGSAAYSYSVLPDKLQKSTTLIVNTDISLARYFITGLRPVTFSDTHVYDFKKFMETDSLYYGYKIFRIRVPDTNLITVRKIVLSANKFSEASKMFNTLMQYKKTNGIKQVQPLIAQFIAKGNDSTRLTVGLFIDREVKPDKKSGIFFERMPARGVFYVAKFNGQFSKRGKVYAELRHYFADHSYQLVLLPFETYVDNKLPANDTDRVNIQVNFATYF
jgi:effector-binding domain-containing protein